MKLQTLLKVTSTIFNYNFVFQQLGQMIMLPGVLGGWKPHLQGRPRDNWQALDRDILVDTKYGKVQGFKAYLYDDPDPRSGYRPGQTPVERIRANVSVFLGIPYALPPVKEARFRVSMDQVSIPLK